MRILWLAFGSAFLLACNGVPGREQPATVRPSSLRACSFDGGCDPGELCEISQSCGPLPDGGVGCGAIEGDQRCHRDCAETRVCAPQENCTEVWRFERTDYAADASQLCL